MLNASRVPVPESTAPSLIIGANGGKRVVCSSQALPHYNRLVALSQRGNYWATLVVRAIIGLNSGRLEKDNIYIDQRNAVPYGKGAFHLVLPGVTAKLIELPSGKYILQSLEVNHEYAALQEEKKRPGLWRIGPKIDDHPEILVDGRITKKDVRPVVIADRTKNPFAKAVDDVRKELTKNQTTALSMQHHGFDLHFTPGGKGIVGLKKATDALASHSEREITKSATLLASTMYMAREQKGVIWFSDFGGSAILTRALQILAHQGTTTLENHAVIMNHPTSKAKEARAAAEALELTAFDKKSGLNPKELLGHFLQIEDLGQKTLAAARTGVIGGGAFAGIFMLSGNIPAAIGVAGGLITVKDAISAGIKNTRIKRY